MGRKFNAMLVIGLIIAILLGSIAIGLDYTEDVEYIKGDKGDRGAPGEDGDDGKDGIGIKGDKGDRGATGSGSKGSTGATGSTGAPGKDCPPNQNPIVTAELNGTYKHTYTHTYIFNITATVDDPEDDGMHVVFYWRKDVNDSWSEKIEYIGNDGIYSAEKTFCYHCYKGNQTLYWLVETWDGSDLGLNYYEYTIIPGGE